MSDFNEETNIISKFEAKLIANKLFEEKIELITMYNEYILYKFFNFILWIIKHNLIYFVIFRAENLLHDKPLTSLNSSKKLLKDVHDQVLYIIY